MISFCFVLLIEPFLELAVEALLVVGQNLLPRVAVRIAERGQLCLLQLELRLGILGLHGKGASPRGKEVSG